MYKYQYLILNAILKHIKELHNISYIYNGRG